jgi:CheY-like chemotaxis protein
LIASNSFNFAEEITSDINVQGKWNILIVDDEDQVHEMTKLTLRDFKYADKKLNFTSVYSAKEAIELLKNNDDFAVVILDIIMENSQAGLEVVEFIRNDLANRTLRIIIRSGEHGQKSQRFIVDNYDINDYREKSELTIERLYTSVRTAIVQYEQISELSQTKDELTELNSGLQLCIDAALEKQKSQTSKEFQNSRLVQMNELLNMLAHQWRQPLSRISTTVANIKLQIALDSYDVKHIDTELEKVDGHIQDLSSTINSFRNLYRIDNGTNVSNLKTVLNETSDLMKPLFEDDFLILELDLETTKWKR